MNLLLLRASECHDGHARIEGARAGHLRDVLGLALGDTVRLGVRDGRIGTGTVVGLGERCYELQIRLERDPPPSPATVLVIALPRPPMFRRILRHVTGFGVKTVAFVHAERVEKSFWSSSVLQPRALDAEVELGLEQAVDTVLPRVILHPGRLGAFLDQELPGLERGGPRLLAAPSASKACPCDVLGPLTLAIGPEGGFVPRELELLSARGFVDVALGSRILRVEAAVTAALGRLLGGIP